MTIIERRALLGDRQAQEECTRKGIMLPCPLCKSKVGYYFIEKHEEGCRGASVVVPGKSYVSCSCGYSVYGIGEKTAIKIHNTRPAPPIGRCKTCANKKRATVNEKGYLICPASGIEITDADFCSWFEPAEQEELSDSELAVDTGYKCLVCANHKLCTTPGLKPLCGESYDHFERGCYVK